MRAKLRVPVPAILSLLVMAAIGCGEDERRPPTSFVDEDPPGRVTDLRFLEFRDSSAVLAWTAPGDDGVVGTVAHYDIRLAAAPLTPPTWASAIEVPPPQTPRGAGATETLRVALRPFGTDLWLALNAVDDEGNWSGMSNTVRMHPDELHWWDGFSDANICCGEVEALVVHNGALLAGGHFGSPSNGGDARTGLARWNGAEWDADEEWIDSEIQTFTTYGGDLIAGGWFETGGDTTWVHVARWDGLAWNGIGDGPNGSVRALADYRGLLIAAGSFTVAGDSAASNIAAWDGRYWHPLGVGLDGTVYAITVFEDRLIAGGAFARAGGLDARGVASWNGLSWQPLGAGIEGAPVHYLTVSRGTLFAGGWLDRTMEEFSSVATWDGIGWTRLPGIEGFEITAMVDFRGDLVIAGRPADRWNLYDNVLRWDGGSWRTLGDLDGSVRALAVDGTSLYVGGAFSRAGPRNAPLVARWDE